LLEDLFGMTDEKKGFFARNKKFLLISFAVYIILMIILVLGTDNSLMPFVYQFG